MLVDGEPREGLAVIFLPDGSKGTTGVSANATTDSQGQFTSVQAELRATKGPILDLRSGAYVKLGPLPAETADRGFVGRILLEKAGKRSVVSHHNKATKGLLVREILGASKAPRSADDLPGFVEDLGFQVEVHQPKKPTDPCGLDIIVYTT